MFTQRLKLTMSLLTVALVISCSSEPKVTEFDRGTDPQTELARIESELQEARTNQMDVISPRNFKLAEKARDRAIDGRAENMDQQKVLHQIALSHSYLEQGRKVSELADQVFAQTMTARKDAVRANSIYNFPVEMSAADKQLTNLTAQIDKNGTRGLEADGNSLEKSYREIELKSIKVEKLGLAKLTTRNAMNEGAEKFAPKTLALAQRSMAHNEALIDANRHDSVVVDRAQHDANTSSNRLLKMVRSAKGASSKKYEDIALQSEQAAMELDQSKNDLSDAGKKLTNVENELADVSDQNRAMASTVLLDQQYTAARSLFSKEEAEVYKVGDKLLIRLKGLSFEKNRSAIASKNYSLLQKVQNVISDVNPSEILIEGHTDSTGNKKLNDDLSKKRAESVQSYLVSNNNIDSNMITAEGLGYSKPISSNKTATGRAQNRRVDVIIKSNQIL
jgi:OOP family OmpA-OmpF porin